MKPRPDAAAFRGDVLTQYAASGTVETIRRHATDAAQPGPFEEQDTILSVRDETGYVWEVSFTLPVVPALTVGDSVSFTYDIQWESFGPLREHLTVIKAGTTVVYIGKGGSLSDLAASPVPLAVGAAQCERITECLTYRGYDLVAGAVTVPSGTTQVIGTCQVTNGGYYQNEGGTSSCADAVVRNAAASVVCTP